MIETKEKDALKRISSQFNRVLAEAPMSAFFYSIGFDCQGESIRVNLSDMRTLNQLVERFECT